MKVRMTTIYAGPRGTANAGELSPDLPADEADALLAAGHALPAREELGADAKATDAADAEAKRAAAEKEAAEKEAAAKEPDHVRAALDRLDPADDEHWTGAGKPAMDIVKELTGSATLTRAELDAIAADFKRPAPTDARAGGDDDAGPGTAGDGDDAGGARSNKP